MIWESLADGRFEEAEKPRGVGISQMGNAIFTCESNQGVVKLLGQCVYGTIAGEAVGTMAGMQCGICENKMLPQKNIKLWVVILWVIFFWPGAIIYALTKQPDTCPFCKSEVYKVGV